MRIRGTALHLSMYAMQVCATRFVRKMRGGGQSHLLQCDDGQFYVVKFRNNPQHPRTLVNEWIASACLNYLRISTPEIVVVNLTVRFLAQTPDVHIQLASRRLNVAPGLHLGSRYPGDPAKLMVYDFLPDVLLDSVVNRNDFVGALVFDKWIGNADARQSIFFRTSRRQRSTSEPRGFVTQMIDHGYAFDGPHWTFTDSPLQGLYFRPRVYTKVRSLDDFEPWLDRVVHFPEEIVHQALRQIPPEWLEGDEAAFGTLFTILMSRRERVPDLIWAARCGRGGISPFPNWEESV
jgi:hypothetical protein